MFPRKISLYQIAFIAVLIGGFWLWRKGWFQGSVASPVAMTVPTGNAANITPADPATVAVTRAAAAGVTS